MLERNQIETILKEQEFSKNSCSSDSCATKAGKLLSVDTVITGSVNKLETYMIAIKFIDVRKGSIEFAETVTARNDDEIKSAVDVLARKASAKIKQLKMTEDEKLRAARNYGVSFHGLYSTPVGDFKDVIKPGYALNFMGEIKLFELGNVDILGIFLGGFLSHEDNVPDGLDKSLDVFCALGGFGVGYFFSSHIECRLAVLGGYAWSRVSGDGSAVSNDPVFGGDVELRYILNSGIFFSINVSYLYTLYTGSDIQVIQSGCGVGYLF